ncbi:MAG: DHA2 family efflux MFS transporter permease subunit [Peptococcaceae bacterium]|nr:DHA2 family efflux MFS transporter permease subunit [Peptococcaceae bacterium]
MNPNEFERKLDARLIISIISAGLMSFTGICAETAMNVIFPTLMNEYNIPTSTVQWVTTINLLMLAIIIPTSSWLKKCFRTKTLFGAAVAIFIVGTLLGMWSPSFLVLIIARILQGIGTGMTLPLMFNIIIEQVPRKNTGMIMGFASLTIALGPAVGPSLGGFIVSIAGWREIFLCLMPFLIISGLGGLTCIRQSSAIEKEPFDLKGFLLIALCFISLIYALSNISHLGLTSPIIWVLLIVAVALLAAFVKHCDGRQRPLLNLSILKNARYSFCLIAILLIQFFTLARGFMIPNLFQLSGGVSTFIAGIIVLPACIIGAVLNPFSGRLFDTLGARVPILFGATMIVLNLLLEMLFMVHVDYKIMMAIAVIFCLGQSFTFGNSTTLALRSLPPERYADGTAVINTLQQLFGAIGTAVGSTIVALGQASHPNDIALGTATGTQWTLYLLFGLSILMYLCIIKALRSEKAAK